MMETTASATSAAAATFSIDEVDEAEQWVKVFTQAEPMARLALHLPDGVAALIAACTNHISRSVLAVRANFEDVMRCAGGGGMQQQQQQLSTGQMVAVLNDAAAAMVDRKSVV